MLPPLLMLAGSAMVVAEYVSDECVHRGNDFGMVGDTREQVKLWRADFQHRMLALGASPIGASMPLRRVADALLAHIHLLTG